MIRVDRDAGTIRLADGELDLLLEAAGPAGAGSAVGTALDPDAVLALASGEWDAPLAAVRDPLVHVELVVAGRSVRQVHRAWVTYDVATLLLAVNGGERQLMHLPPAFLTASLVRLTRLRPRRTASPGVVVLPADNLDGLVSPDEEVRRAALEAARADLGWRLHATWPGGERLMHAADGPHGVHLADPATGTLRGASNTFVYRVLSTLLPTDAELAPA